MTDTSAVLQGSVDALGQTGTYQFEYGSTALYGARTAAQPLGAASRACRRRSTGSARSRATTTGCS